MKPNYNHSVGPSFAKVEDDLARAERIEEIALIESDQTLRNLEDWPGNVAEVDNNLADHPDYQNIAKSIMCAMGAVFRCKSKAERLEYYIRIGKLRCEAQQKYEYECAKEAAEKSVYED